MSGDPNIPLFLALEEQMRAAGYGAMVDHARQNARADFLRTLRAYLEFRRQQQYVRGVVSEAIFDARTFACTYGYFRRQN